MKYLNRMLLLINSIMITSSQIEDYINNGFIIDNTSNTDTNPLEITEYKEYDISLLSEYQKYITIYQKYSIHTNICMILSIVLYLVFILYRIFILFSLIKEAKESNLYEKIIEVTLQILSNVVLVILLVIPITYNNIFLNIICFIPFILLYFFLFIYSSYCVFNYNNRFNIFLWINKPEYIPIELVLILGLIVWIVLSITPRIIEFKEEEKIVIQNINNWFSTSTIMRYILRYINNKFNIFNLSLSSTNITLSESFFSLLFSSLSALYFVYGCKIFQQKKEEDKEQKKEDRKKKEKEQKLKKDLDDLQSELNKRHNEYKESIGKKQEEQNEKRKLREEEIKNKTKELIERARKIQIELLLNHDEIQYVEYYSFKKEALISKRYKHYNYLKERKIIICEKKYENHKCYEYREYCDNNWDVIKLRFPAGLYECILEEYGYSLNKTIDCFYEKSKGSSTRKYYEEHEPYGNEYKKYYDDEYKNKNQTFKLRKYYHYQKDEHESFQKKYYEERIFILKKKQDYGYDKWIEIKKEDILHDVNIGEQ